MARLSSAVRLLQDLISIPSVNPDGFPGTHLTGEKEMAHFLQKHLTGMGAKVFLQQVEKDRPNVVAIFPSKRKPTRRVLLAPHTDTVSVSGMSIPPFTPTIRSGKIYGRGSTDTKGSIAAMFSGLGSLKNLRDSECEFTFVGLMAEESFNWGAKYFAKKCPKYDLAIVGEPTGMKIVHGFKGTAWLRLSAQGKAAHGSQPSLGENAIDLLRTGLDRLEPKLKKLSSHSPHPLLGQTTFNLGTIRGGAKINIVPSRCEAEIDIRYTPGIPLEKLLKTWQQKVKPAHLELMRSDRPFILPENHSCLKIIRPFTRGLDVAAWFCDASLLAEAGIPSIAMGPGSIAQAHTADEYLKITDLEDSALRFSKMFEALTR